MNYSIPFFEIHIVEKHIGLALGGLRDPSRMAMASSSVELLVRFL
jgi:hypothetical protein